VAIFICIHLDIRLEKINQAFFAFVDK